jgi:hypothetical protein
MPLFDSKSPASLPGFSCTETFMDETSMMMLIAKIRRPGGRERILRF